MGCHTWLHAKVKEQPTYEDIKQNVINSHIQEIGWFDKYLNNNLPEEDKWLFDNDTVESVLYKKALYQRRLNIIQKDLCKVGVCNFYNNDLSNEDEFGRSHELVVSDDNQSFVLYVDLAGKNATPKEEWYHDVFRISGYPEDKLYSYKETMEFLHKNNHIVTYGPMECRNPDEPDWDKRKWYEIDRQLHQMKCQDRLKEFWDKHPDGMIRFG